MEAKTIKCLSEELGISKEAIYKKLKYQLKGQLEGHVVKIDNITHIDEAGQRAIRQSLSHERKEAIQMIIDVEPAVEGGSQPHITEYIQLLEEQLKVKDEQIQSQNGHIGLLIRQMGNNHLLSQAERLRGLLTVGEGVAAKEHKSIWRRMFRK